MRHGTYLTILRQNVSQVNGKQKHHQGRRKFALAKAERKSDETTEIPLKNELQDIFEQLYERWNNCADVRGQHFEV
ncbi:hypothetical protein TNCV_5087171 [Trichonephila clavipes]|nr:hypothetical protein TNCV_5087171 [Trichonephila clavipes]